MATPDRPPQGCREPKTTNHSGGGKNVKGFPSGCAEVLKCSVVMLRNFSRYEKMSSSHAAFFLPTPGGFLCYRAPALSRGTPQSPGATPGKFPLEFWILWCQEVSLAIPTPIPNPPWGGGRKFPTPRPISLRVRTSLKWSLFGNSSNIQTSFPPDGEDFVRGIINSWSFDKFAHGPAQQYSIC